MSKTFQAFFPASRFDLDYLKQGIQLCKDRLNFKNIDSLPPTPNHFYAGTTHARGKSFLDALYNHADLIWAARGGYGTIEWMDLIKDNLKNYQNKTFIGYSDLTTLHSHLTNLGHTSIHGPMLATKNFLDADNTELQSLLLCIENQSQQYNIEQGAQKEGRLVGGNLSVLSHSMGTDYQLQLKDGDLLFLEDINEAPYALARSLKQLSFSPNFEQCHIIWGQLTQCSKEGDLELLKFLMSPYKNTWSYGLECGHDRPNYSIKLGKHAKLKENCLIQ